MRLAIAAWNRAQWTPSRNRKSGHGNPSPTARRDQESIPTKERFDHLVARASNVGAPECLHRLQQMRRSAHIP